MLWLMVVPRLGILLLLVTELPVLLHLHLEVRVFLEAEMPEILDRGMQTASTPSSLFTVCWELRVFGLWTAPFCDAVTIPSSISKKSSLPLTSSPELSEGWSQTGDGDAPC